MDSKLLTGDAVYKKKTGSSSLGVPTGSLDGYAREPYRPYKPYDALKQAQKDTVSRPSVSGTELKPGDKVKHIKFGEGLVIDANDKVVTVAFRSEGIKKLAKDLAPMKKI